MKGINEMINSTSEHNRMYQIINEEVVEVVRHGDELLPVTDPRTSQILGQLTLELTYGETNV
jgi:hypothetical protein